MKCVVIQYLLAIERLVNSGLKPQRTIDLSFVPDEEIGGIDGIKQLLDSELFDRNNYEVALDEGLANEANCYTIFYGERTPYWFTVTAKGINNCNEEMWVMEASLLRKQLQKNY